MRRLALFSFALLSLGSAACSQADGSAAGSSDLTESISVEPFATLGTGQPGFGPNDINPPDGVAFDARGSLLLTDAFNHRIQVWDVRNVRRLGDFGSAEIFHGEVVDLAVAPTGKVIVTDETAYVGYAFEPPTGEEGDMALAGYKYTGPDMFAAEGNKKVGGIAIDSHNRIYTVDARRSLVRRYDAQGNLDPTFAFEAHGSGQYLNGCEGVVVDEKRNNLYVASEGDSVIRVFDLEDGHYKDQMIGGKRDPDHPATPGESVFQAAVEGLWILDDYLLASDEADGGTGHVQIFDLTEATAFDTGPEEYARMKEGGERSGYIGSFGELNSPDSVAAFTDSDGESYVAVADQGNYRVLLYRWSAIVEAAHIARP